MHEHCLHILSKDERMRADGFKFERLRHDFIVCRGTLRSILSNYCHRRPQDLRFGYTENGKPYLEETPDLNFNLSHSSGLMMCAVGFNREVGIDAELIDRKTPCLELANRYFSVEEADLLRAAPHEAREKVFFQIWTRKESYVKALGFGLSVPLNSFSVFRAQEHWSIVDIDAGPNYAAALSVEGFDWQPDFFEATHNVFSGDNEA